MGVCRACGEPLSSRAHGRRFCSLPCRREGERQRRGLRRNLDRLIAEERRLQTLEQCWQGRDEALRRVGGADRIPEELAALARRRRVIERDLDELGGRL